MGHMSASEILKAPLAFLIMPAPTQPKGAFLGRRQGSNGNGQKGRCRPHRRSGTEGVARFAAEAWVPRTDSSPQVASCHLRLN